MDVLYPCITCSREVRRRQHALACDSCGEWMHRKCGTGVRHSFSPRHLKINSEAGRPDLALYLLVPLLKAESRHVDLTIRLVSAHQLTRMQRQRYRRVQGALFDLWDRFEDDELTTTQLLREASVISGLAFTPSDDPVYDEDVE